MLRGMLAAAAFVALTTAGALAQDWSGFYVGALAGGTSVSASASIGSTGVTFNPAPSGSVAGGLIGLNWQKGPSVMGLEAEYGGIWNGAPSSSLTYAPDPVVNTTSEGSTLRVRARFGVTDDAWMFYVAGGWTQSSLQLQLTSQAPFAGHGSNQTHTLSGYNAGAGLEYAFSPHISGRIEYIWDHLGSTSYRPSDTFFSTRYLSNIQESTYRATLNVRF
jgi:outer membrane immunogenic protein